MESNNSSLSKSQIYLQNIGIDINLYDQDTCTFLWDIYQNYEDCYYSSNPFDELISITSNRKFTPEQRKLAITKFFDFSYEIHKTHPDMSPPEQESYIINMINFGLNPEYSPKQIQNIYDYFLENNSENLSFEDLVSYRKNFISYIPSEVFSNLSEDNINLISNKSFTEIQSLEILEGFKDYLSQEQISLYANPNLTSYQMDTIRGGLNLGLSNEQIKMIANEKYDPEQMNILINACTQGLNKEQLEFLCNIGRNYSNDILQTIELGMEWGLSIEKLEKIITSSSSEKDIITDCHESVKQNLPEFDLYMKFNNDLNKVLKEINPNLTSSLVFDYNNIHNDKKIDRFLFEIELGSPSSAELFKKQDIPKNMMNFIRSMISVNPYTRLDKKYLNTENYYYDIKDKFETYDEAYQTSLALKNDKMAENIEAIMNVFGLPKGDPIDIPLKRDKKYGLEFGVNKNGNLYLNKKGKEIDEKTDTPMNRANMIRKMNSEIMKENQKNIISYSR